MTREEWRRLARKRIRSILARQRVANARTLEQKISDAGPNDQRVDPHILTEERNALVRERRVIRIVQGNAPWFFLANTPEPTVRERLQKQLPIFQALQEGDRGLRVGQCLEIAIYRALLRQDTFEYLGDFMDLDDHDDSRLYSKEEPPRALNGKRLHGNQRLDFLIRDPEAGWAGIEAKNVREWLYPSHDEIRDLLGKAVALDCVPVLIARRFQYSAFTVLFACGVVVHQNYNQLLPEADRDLAEQAKDKRLLGYHDIRVGNKPDNRLIKFIEANLPRILPEARERFDKHKELIEDYTSGRISYKVFANRVLQRSPDAEDDREPPVRLRRASERSN